MDLQDGVDRMEVVDFILDSTQPQSFGSLQRNAKLMPKHLYGIFNLLEPNTTMTAPINMLASTCAQMQQSLQKEEEESLASLAIKKPLCESLFITMSQ